MDQARREHRPSDPVDPVNRWWHRKVLKHKQEERRVSAPLWDISAKGLLVKCSCGTEWAL